MEDSVQNTNNDEKLSRIKVEESSNDHEELIINNTSKLRNNKKRVLDEDNNSDDEIFGSNRLNKTEFYTSPEKDEDLFFNLSPSPPNEKQLKYLAKTSNNTIQPVNQSTPSLITKKQNNSLNSKKFKIEEVIKSNINNDAKNNIIISKIETFLMD